MDNNTIQHLKLLLQSYHNAPEIFQAGRYWKTYEDQIIAQIEKADFNQLRSGAYPIFGTFGFSESVYHYNQQLPFHVKIAKKLIRRFFIDGRATLPYSLRLEDIRESAYRLCLASGKAAGLTCISEIETSQFGKPADLFEISGKKYTMQFLSFYLRLCFAQKHLKISGNETIVELGSGSGFQVEVLKKVFPALTIICFDLPYPLVLCEKYLEQALPKGSVCSSQKTLKWSDLSQVEHGKVNMLGNWQFPMLEGFEFDIFWNAASFGEMEPAIVQNYLNYVLVNAKQVFLLQARHGKESSENSGVVDPIRFEDYNKWLSGYELLSEEDAYEAHRRMSQSGGYFQAVWNKAT